MEETPLPHHTNTISRWLSEQLNREASFKQAVSVLKVQQLRGQDAMVQSMGLTTYSGKPWALVLPALLASVYFRAARLSVAQS